VKTALLLIAHGSREDGANADLQHIVGAMRRRGHYAIVEPAFLEIAEPTMESGGQRCVEQGAERVILLPYFLSAGVHVRRDLQEFRSRLAERHPQVTFYLAEPLGPDPVLLDVLTRRAVAAEDA